MFAIDVGSFKFLWYPCSVSRLPSVLFLRENPCLPPVSAVIYCYYWNLLHSCIFAVLIFLFGVGMRVRCGKVIAFYNFKIKSQVFTWLIYLGCDLHGYFPSGIAFFPPEVGRLKGAGVGRMLCPN